MSDQPGCPCFICDEDYMNQSDRRDSAGQSADLRARIAAVLYEDGQRPMNTAVRLADAVIRELGLPPHWAKPSFDNGSRHTRPTAE